MRRFLLCLTVLLSLTGCTAKPAGVRIFAAVSTKEALEQCARDFQMEHGSPVVCSFAGSSTLARQIENGADADLFLSADERWADHLADKGLVAERCAFLGNRLVVVTPAAHPLQMAQLADLAGPQVKHLALALDPVPAGHYAREALKKAEIWPKLEERVRESNDVRAALALVARDEADAGIVYATDALTSDRVRVALKVPENLHSPIRYPLVLLRRGHDSVAARLFYEYLQTVEGSTPFDKAGFEIILESGTSAQSR